MLVIRQHPHSKEEKDEDIVCAPRNRGHDFKENYLKSRDERTEVN